jgi:hypothetical protein
MTPPTMLDRLDDYLSSEMSDADAEAFEAELFADGGPPPEVTFADTLARISAHLASRGTFHPGATRAHIAALEAAGYRIAHQDVRPGEEQPLAAPPPDVDFVVTRIDVDLRGTTNVEVETVVKGHGPVKTFRDVVFDPEDGAIYGLCERELAVLGFQVGATRSTVTAVRNGVREVIAVFETRPVT